MSEKPTNQQAEQGTQPLPSEFSLTEYPLYLLSKTVPKGTDTIDWQQTLHVNGQAVEQSWRVGGNPALGGLPAAPDGEALMAIRYAAHVDGLKSPYVPLARVWSLFQQLGHTDSGTVYRRFKAAIRKWTGVKIVTRHAMWDSQGREYERERAFGILDEYDLIEPKRTGRKGPPRLFGHVRLSDYLYRRLKNGHTFELDFAQWCQLEHPATRRAYEYLEKQRGRGHASYTIEIRAFLTKLGYSRAAVERYPVKKCKQLLRETHSGSTSRPAVLELLKTRNYLSGYSFRQTAQGKTLLVVWWATPKPAQAANPFGLSGEQVEQAEALASYMGEILGNYDQNKAYYFTVWAQAIKGRYTEAVHRALGLTKEAMKDPAVTAIRTTPSQYFTDQLDRLKLQYDLFTPPPPKQGTPPTTSTEEKDETPAPAGARPPGEAPGSVPSASGQATPREST